jgi:hypothetical protein
MVNPQRWRSCQEIILVNLWNFEITVVSWIFNSKSRGIWRLYQMWKLFLLEESITMQSLESFRTLEVTFSYFTSWNQFDIWIIFGIFEKGLPDPVHRKSMGQIRLKLAWSNPAWPGPRPTGANLAPRARRRFPTAQCSPAPPRSPKPTPCSPPFWPCHGFPPQPRAPPRSRLILCESPNVEAKSPFTFSSSRTTSMSRSSPCLCSSRAAEANRHINAVGRAAPRRWPSHRLSLPLPCQSCCRIAYTSATPSFFRHRWQPPPDTSPARRRPHEDRLGVLPEWTVELFFSTGFIWIKFK